MRKISPNILKRLLKDNIPCLRKKILNDHVCQGRTTYEHVWVFAGRQIDEYFSIIPLCAYSHSVDLFQDGGILNKEINEWLSLGKVRYGDLDKYYKKDWNQRKRYLESVYGKVIPI